ncbi:MAG: CoF synthetase [Urechidicola sp.]|nr:CoF synthetase [Urechidicola sp.]
MKKVFSKFNIHRALDRIRNRSYRFIDYIQGRHVKNHYDDIKFMMRNYGSEKAIQKRAAYLNDILNHAVTTTTFFKNYQNFKSIEDFPVANRNIIADNFEDFKSYKFSKRNTHEVSTSGSTGVPFKTLHNKHKCLRHNAEVIYLGERANFTFGQKLVYFKLWPKLRYKNWILNKYHHSVLALEDNDIERLLKEIKGECRTGMLGYSSAFERICKYLDKSNKKPLKDCNVNSIISMSERLNDYTKKAVKKYFKTTIVSRYSTMELGIMAQEELNRVGHFKINSGTFYIEIFDMNLDKPVKNGTYGRIIVTDLFNYAVPLIRYDTGDVGQLEIIKNEKGEEEPFLVNIEGRKLDLILNTKGEILPSQISMYMAKYGNFKQFQFVQCGEKEYILKLNTDKKVEEEEKLIYEYKSVLGDDANVKIEYVEGIPLLGSGKKKEVENTYLKSSPRHSLTLETSSQTVQHEIHPSTHDVHV